MTRFLAPRLSQCETRSVLPAPKLRAAHYATPEHKRWASDVIKRAGHACQGCGRARVRLFADHIIELRDGGAATDVANGQALCGACHTTKTAKARADRMIRPVGRGA